MQVPSVSLASPSVAQLAQSNSEASTLVLKKVLDMQSDQGAKLAQMVAQGSGVGQAVDMYA